MVYDAETTARNAEKSTTNSPGYCLQWSRERAGAPAVYPDASTAWRNTNDRHPGDRNPPRGSMVYWTGGSHGYGHIAVAVGGGKVRSTDSGGSGRVATVAISWPETYWGLPYAGWSWDVNETTIPHDNAAAGGGGEDDMNQTDTIAKWSPDDGASGDTTIGKTLNQARGYAEDAYQRVKALETKVDKLSETVDKIWQATK